MVSLTARVSVPEGVLFREVDGEAVLLQLTSGRYYGLDTTGTRMWTLLADHGELAPVLEALIAEYDAEPARLERDLLELVERLVDCQLLELSEG